MNHLKNLREAKLQELLATTVEDLHTHPQDINLTAQRRALEEELAYVQHFGNSRKRRGFR